MILKSDGNGGYVLSAKNANKILGTLATAAVGICISLVVWGVRDAGWKAATDARLSRIEADVQAMNKAGILPRAEERLNDHERRLNRIEGDHRRADIGQ